MAIPGFAATRTNVTPGTILGGSRMTFSPAATVGRPNMMLQLYEEARKAQQEAKQANLARFGEVKGILTDRRSRILADLGLQGQQERSQINRAHAERSGRTRADLAARGMLGTTVAPTLQAGLDRQRDETMGGLEERLQRLRADYDSGLTKDLADFIERRNDTGPSMAMLAQLAQQAGRSGASRKRGLAALGPITISQRSGGYAHRT